ncbi:auxin efflux carrier [Radiomyces spectabilis]|uniref:auxin efflux carrier n=1 Tax=Radiomyces spectabilis TaxID=64574 RepID=UPI00221F23D5|nr:auxin efflux carrier [Radiomyces spectabilis]KAI8393632.1 auxin efflux carrier [Radiomyces spectabilis]
MELIDSVQAIFQVMTIVLLGYLLTRKGYFTMDKQKWLSKLNMVFFTPCLLFSNIASIISLEKLLAFWPIPAFYLVFAIISFSASQITSRLVGLNAPYRRFVLACVMFSNTNSLPIAIISSLAVSEAGNILFWDTDDTEVSVAARGISYTLFFAIFGNLIRWSYGYSLLQKHEPKAKASSLSETSPLLATFPFPSIAQSRAQSLTRSLKTNAYLFARKVDNFMSPPLYAAVLALIVGLSPLKGFLYDKDSFMYPSFTKAIETCGRASVPIILTCLGSQLACISESQHHSHAVRKPVFTAISVRLLLMPLFVIPIVIAFVLYGSRWSTLASDPVFIVMMIVLGCTPTAINLVQITQVNDFCEEEMLRMLFWSYGVICIPVCTFTVFTALSVVDKLL